MKQKKTLIKSTAACMHLQLPNVWCSSSAGVCNTSYMTAYCGTTDQEHRVLYISLFFLICHHFKVQKVRKSTHSAFNLHWSCYSVYVLHPLTMYSITMVLHQHEAMALIIMMNMDYLGNHSIYNNDRKYIIHPKIIQQMQYEWQRNVRRSGYIQCRLWRTGLYWY